MSTNTVVLVEGCQLCRSNWAKLRSLKVAGAQSMALAETSGRPFRRGQKPRLPMTEISSHQSAIPGNPLRSRTGDDQRYARPPFQKLLRLRRLVHQFLRCCRLVHQRQVD